VLGAALALALGPLAGCGTTHTPPGTALASEGGDISLGDKPIRPGTELGLLDVALYNDTASPLTIRSVIVRGEGIGTVVKVVEIRIAPAHSTKDNRVDVNTVTGAAYGTNPPVNYYTRCHKQILKPVSGFVLDPNGTAHLWVVIRAERPGKYNIPAHVVTYTDKGVLYRQRLTLSVYGSVADNASRATLSPGEARCIKATRTTILSGFEK
jgi:hypothetical protein